MLKQTKDKCFKKKLNENDIKKYRKQIENMEVDYQNILKEESYEKELRKAEMETKKIENLLEHTEEIYNRPKKYQLTINFNLKQKIFILKLIL